MNRLLLCFTLFVSLSCAHKSLEPQKWSSLRDIGVVAMFEEQMPIRYIGTTVLSNKELTTPIQSWSVNKTVLTRTREELGRMNKKVLDITLDPQKIQHAKSQAQSLKNIYLGNRYQELEQYVLSEAEKQGASYIFVMYPTSHENFPQYKPGFGFLCRAPMMQKGDLEIYSLLRGEIWNTKTKEVEARAIITPADVFMKTGISCEEAQKMSPEKLAALYKEQLMSLVRKSVDVALSKTL